MPEYNEAQKSVLAAVDFEVGLRRLLGQSMKKGLTIAGGLGVLTLMSTEIQFEYLNKTRGE